jgi:hypothetical protein
MINSDQLYRRTEIDNIFTKTKTLMQQADLIRGGDSTARYIDDYTGKSSEVVHIACNDYN